jgi:hypothetical protein
MFDWYQLRGSILCIECAKRLCIVICIKVELPRFGFVC